MVAKSYQSLKIVSKPFASNGRYYVNVVTKNGDIKPVRWYTEAQYLKMYPEEAVNFNKPQKEVLGFEKGYITIFKGNTYEDKEYFKMNSARYTSLWGWYFISSEELPNDIPNDVEPVRLNWELVGNDDGSLKSDEEITAAVESLLYEPDISEYQGSIGDKVDVIVTVERAIDLDGYYGHSTMHIMRDYDGNCFVWTTASKTWAEGSEHHIIGTIKDLKQYKNTKQTVLTRCREVKD